MEGIQRLESKLNFKKSEKKVELFKPMHNPFVNVEN